MNVAAGPERPAALIMVDFQKRLCLPGADDETPLAAEVRSRGVLDHARRCLEVARRRALFVVHTALAFDAGFTNRTNTSPRFDAIESSDRYLMDGTTIDHCDEVTPVHGELVVRKGGVDPFVGTPLFGALARRGITRVFIAGVMTNLAVESAARHAADMGYQVTVLTDACASASAELHHFSIENALPYFGTTLKTEDFESSH